MNSEYAVVIIGGGPAGLTAGLYTSRARLKSLLIERGIFGGQITEAEAVENFPGFPQGIPGLELGQRLHEQAIKYGLETRLAEFTGLELQGEKKRVLTTEGEFTSRAVIIALGSERLKLGVPGEAEFTGRGVSYCATCDAAFFGEVPVAVVGGGNSAITEALHLAKFASSVTVVHRRAQLRATRILQERAQTEPKINFLWDSVVEQVEGDDRVRNLSVRQVKTGKKTAVPLAGVFIAIGFKPNTAYFKDLLSLDESGLIITGGDMETSAAGVFAAGDVRHQSGRQAITAAGDGATAAIYAERFLSDSR